MSANPNDGEVREVVDPGLSQFCDNSGGKDAAPCERRFRPDRTLASFSVTFQEKVDDAAESEWMATDALPRYSRKEVIRACALFGVFAGLAVLFFLVNSPSSPARAMSGRQSADILQRQIEEDLMRSDFSAAWKKLDRLKTLATESEYHQARGALLMLDSRDYEGAAEAFERALSVDPGSRELVFYLAEALFASRRYAEAEVRYRELRKSWPDNPILRYRQYLCAALMGHRERAKFHIEQSSGAFQSPSWFYIRATEAYWNGQTEEARRYLHAARSMHREKTRMFDLTLEKLGFQSGLR